MPQYGLRTDVFALIDGIPREIFNKTDRKDIKNKVFEHFIPAEVKLGTDEYRKLRKKLSDYVTHYYKNRKNAKKNANKIPTSQKLYNTDKNHTDPHNSHLSDKPQSDDPPRAHHTGGGGPSILSKSLQAIIEMAPELKNIPSWMGPLVVEEIRRMQQSESKNRIIIRPAVFHPKQHELIDAVKDPSIKLIFCQGAQRSGKSTGVMQGLHEVDVEFGKPWKILLLAGKGGQSGKDGGAKGILSDLLRDPFLDPNNKKLLDLGARTNDHIKWMHSGMSLTATDLTVAAIKGGDQDFVWIDEMDVAIKKGKEKREAVVSAVNTMLAVPHFKLILTANLDKGLYQVLVDRVFELGYGRDSIKTISIFKADCPHLEGQDVAENYEIAQVFTEVLLDKGMAKMRLQGVMDYQGDIFDQESIKDAYAIYETLLATTFSNPETFWLETEYNVLAIDPSGQGHPWGYFLGGVRDNFFIEIKSGEMEMGYDDTGQKWTPERLNLFIYKLIKQYNVKYVVLESNTGGPALEIYIRQKGYKNVEFQNFGAEGKSNARSNYLQVARNALENRAVALKNRNLHPQLTIYDPDERDKTDRKVSQKGDLADAFIHFLWKASGGLLYIPDQKPHLNQKVRIL